MREELATRHRDAAIARIASRQHGVLNLGQLLIAGVTRSGITRRLAAGRLHRIHRGVYAVGHPNVSNEGKWMAAVLACGDGTVLSHRSAGALWGILKADRRAGSRGGVSERVPGVAVVEVTVAGIGGRSRRAGIRVHRSITLAPADCTRRDRIPVTSPARTLQDLHRVLPNKQFASALREAEYLQLPLDPGRETDGTRSDLERLFLSLCRRHRLPQPGVNVGVDRYLVDFLWQDQRVVVELDGWESHRTRSAFEEDRARDARLKVLGYEVLRFTWRQVEDEPRELARVVRAVLRR